MSSSRQAARLLLLSLIATSCRGGEKSRPDVAAVERCEAGILRALEAPTRVEGYRIYYQSCKDIHVEPVCRDAFGAAAQVDPDQALVVVGNPCKDAYCPILPNANSLEACGPNFQITRETAFTSWPPLHNSIVDYDTKQYSKRVLSALMLFYVRSMKQWPVGATAAGASAPAPRSSSSSTAPAVAPSASGAPEPH
jgi:hypothetical protein